MIRGCRATVILPVQRINVAANVWLFVSEGPQ